jgi:exopolysaccharide production protein ExoZ
MDKQINVLWLLFIAVAITYFFSNFYSQFYGFSRITAWGIPAAMIILSVLKLEKANKFTVPSPLVNIGNMSFSIYIVHAGIIGLLTKIVLHIFKIEEGDYSVAVGLSIFTIAILITFLISKFTYKFFESTISYKLRNWFLTRKIFSRKCAKLQNQVHV